MFRWLRRNLQRNALRNDPFIVWYMLANGRRADMVVPADIAGKVMWLVRPEFQETGTGSGFWKLLNDALLWDGCVVRRFRDGLVFDGESVPWCLRWAERKNTCLEAALPHDDGYLYHATEAWNVLSGRWEWLPASKLSTDLLFHKVYEQARPGCHMAAIKVYWAVLFFGWFAWRGGTCDRNCENCPNGNETRTWCPHYNKEWVPDWDSPVPASAKQMEKATCDAITSSSSSRSWSSVSAPAARTTTARSQ